MAIIKCTNSIFIPPLLSVHMSSFMHLPVLCFSPIFWKIFIYKIIRNGDLKVFDYFFYDLYTFVVPELWDFILWNIVSCMHVRPLTSILPLLILFKLQHIIGNGGKSFGPLCFIWGFRSLALFEVLNLYALFEVWTSLLYLRFWTSMLYLRF
jgi:hypothetical protein